MSRGVGTLLALQGVEAQPATVSAQRSEVALARCLRCRRVFLTTQGRVLCMACRTGLRVVRWRACVHAVDMTTDRGEE